ncbi:hypothetical protein AB0K60_19545 [Thermopolyspora sp. NPDC052614]|uniref:hypothetical protein n=1 Tax=Thermopolyspora sp. NPDC052614 TaxID=3155682 RepID=UPI0034408BF6
MAEYEPPDDLVELQRRFFELDTLCSELDGDELAVARADRLNVVMQKQAHPWWSNELFTRRYPPVAPGWYGRPRWSSTTSTRSARSTCRATSATLLA